MAWAGCGVDKEDRRGEWTGFCGSCFGWTDEENGRADRKWRISGRAEEEGALRSEERAEDMVVDDDDDDVDWAEEGVRRRKWEVAVCV